MGKCVWQMQWWNVRVVIKFSRKNISCPLFIEWPEESIHAKELVQFP